MVSILFDPREPYKSGSLSNLNDESEIVLFKYNPTTWNVSSGVNYAQVSPIGTSDPALLFLHGNLENVNFNVLLDDNDGRRKSRSEKSYIEQEINLIRSFKIPERQQRRLLKAPPPLLFALGNDAIPCRLLSYDIQIFKIYSDGTKRQARASLSLGVITPESRKRNDVKQKGFNSVTFTRN